MRNSPSGKVFFRLRSRNQSIRQNDGSAGATVPPYPNTIDNSHLHATRCLLNTRSAALPAKSAIQIPEAPEGFGGLEVRGWERQET
jgi:hypothetical protein